MGEGAWNENRPMSIFEVSGLLGVSSSALRYYERVGLLSPCRDERSNYRGYSQKEVIQLSDVVLYRNTGVSVKDVEHLVGEPISKTLEALDDEMSRKLEEMEEIRLSLLAIGQFSRRIRRYLAPKGMPVRLVDEPGVKRLLPFDLLSKEALGQYFRQSGGLRCGAFFPSASEPEAFVDASIDEGLDVEGEPVWDCASCHKDGERFANFLLTTDYGDTDVNDLPQTMEQLEAEGVTCGYVVAEYLAFDTDMRTGRRIDCYEAWAQVL